MTVSGVERNVASAAVLDGAGWAAAEIAKTRIALAIGQPSRDLGMSVTPCETTSRRIRKDSPPAPRVETGRFDRADDLPAAVAPQRLLASWLCLRDGRGFW